MGKDWDRLAQAIYDRRAELGLSRQRVADMAGVSLGSVKNLEKKGRSYERTPPSLAAVAEVLGWTRESPQAVLAGGDPALVVGATQPPAEDVPLEARYQRRESVTDAGHLVGVVEDMLYQVFITGAPDAPFEEYDRTRRRIFEVLHDAGIDVAERHDGTSSGTGKDT